MNRRNFLSVIAGAALLRGADVSKRDMIVLSRRPEDLEMPLAGFLDEITPVEHFFVRTHDYVPQVEPKDWRLKISGAVRSELTLTLEDIKRLPKVELTAVLECAGNGRSFYNPPVPGAQWAYGAVGNGRWAGARLADVLSKAGVKGDPYETLFSGADHPPGTMPAFQRAMPLAKALHKDTLLAYELNGEPLPAAHGFPLRIVAPGWAGDSWMKWLGSIEVRETPFEGFFMKSAYRHPGKGITPGATIDPAQMRPVEEIGVKSVIATPLEGAFVSPGRVRIAGAAWSGTSPIETVEVSVDRGRTWRAAKLLNKKTSYGFRLFEDTFNAAAGFHVVMARARNERGDTQPLVEEWNPSGYLYNVVQQVAFTAGDSPKNAPVAAGLTSPEPPVGYQSKCLICHEEDMMRQQRITRAQWEKEIDKMTRWGAPVKSEDREALLDYLVKLRP